MELVIERSYSYNILIKQLHATRLSRLSGSWYWWVLGRRSYMEGHLLVAEVDEVDDMDSLWSYGTACRRQ